MGTKALREFYGGNSRQAMARAIRAEIENGEAILAAESQATGRVAKEGVIEMVNGEPRHTLAACQLANARARREAAEDIVRTKWGMPPRVGSIKK